MKRLLPGVPFCCAVASGSRPVPCPCPRLEGDIPKRARERPTVRQLSFSCSQPLSFSLLLVVVVKASVGRLRPDFLARCKPVDGVCTGPPALVAEGRKSARRPQALRPRPHGTRAHHRCRTRALRARRLSERARGAGVRLPRLRGHLLGRQAAAHARAAAGGHQRLPASVLTLGGAGRGRGRVENKQQRN